MSYQISLQFEWVWILIALYVVGLPLLALLSILRASYGRDRARQAALATLGAALLAGLAIAAFVTDEARYFGGPLVLGSLILLVTAWTWMLVTTRFWRFWGDLVVIGVPTLLGAWAWAIE